MSAKGRSGLFAPDLGAAYCAAKILNLRLTADPETSFVPNRKSYAQIDRETMPPAA
jgi:hypothetical protein